jgi:hypothetical protein
MRLQSQILEVPNLGDEVQTEMFALYRNHYDAISKSRFLSDLGEKSNVILLRDDKGILRGFSTLMIWTSVIPQGSARVLFSGDTIIDRSYWGTQALSFNWLRFAGNVKKQQPNTPLFWLLIVKGHRTYRYLPTFAIEYYPNWRKKTPDLVQKLIHQFAYEKFGRHYQPDKGIVHYGTSRGHLTPDLAVISPQEAMRPEVSFFLKLNPNYVQGDELVCLCELNSNNLKPIARRHFDKGLHS